MNTTSKFLFVFFSMLWLNTSGWAQKASEFTLQDTLRGSITPERAWWDLTYYHLSMQVNPKDSSLTGSNLIGYKVLSEHNNMQIDLQPPMSITSVSQGKAQLPFTRLGNVYYITFPEKQAVGSKQTILVNFSGKPVVSTRPPWSGGLTWQKDTNGKDFIATSCQGDGASLWWPNKDHGYDEPDSMLMSITVPDHLTDVSNGRLRKVEHNKKAKTKTFHWFVSNPINNYGVNINIGDYVHFSDEYMGEKGKLTCDYYVLPYNIDKAKKQFADAKRMFQALEHWFGPYPFYEDGFKLVEVPYLGMEHQSSVTYGNQFLNGYLGRDLSQSGWGLKFDFIIIHESGHEWFANNITAKDIADMWIQESFTAYSENLFLDFHYGKQASSEYVVGTRANIQNDKPIIGVYNVNQEGSGDMYYKGANLLHTIRQIVDNDTLWRQTLRGLNKQFYHQTVTTQEIENYIAQQTGKKLDKVFDQYLRDVRIPILEYYIKDKKLVYRWGNVIKGFDMPIKAMINGETVLLKPTKQWQEYNSTSSFNNLAFDHNYYVATLNVWGK